MMDLSIIGTGYVGLVTGAGLAEKGHNIVCVDIDKKKVNLINKKISPIYEKGLDDILEEVVGKKLRATIDIKEAILNTEGCFVSVGTPSNCNGEICLDYIKQTSKDIGISLKEKDEPYFVIVKSTVVPETTDKVVLPLLEEYSGKKAVEDFGVGNNPEFLREGKAVEDFRNPDRIILGANDRETMKFLNNVYKDFKSTKLKTNIETAEMIKYAANSLLATKISFSNEIGNICKELKIDVYDVMEGVGLDSRISKHFLRAGPGFGGSCFPKDVAALVYKAKEVGIKPTLLESVLEVNKNQPKRVVELVKKRYTPLKNKKIAVLGLAFKVGTDDMRESPTIPIIESLIDEGANIYTYDPQATENAKKLFGSSINYALSLKDALKDSELALILTEWEEFRTLDYNLMKEKNVFDTRRILDIDSLPSDVNYEGLCW